MRKIEICSTIGKMLIEHTERRVLKNYIDVTFNYFPEIILANNKETLQITYENKKFYIEY